MAIDFQALQNSFDNLNKSVALGKAQDNPTYNPAYLAAKAAGQDTTGINPMLNTQNYASKFLGEPNLGQNINALQAGNVTGNNLQIQLQAALKKMEIQGEIAKVQAAGDQAVRLATAQGDIAKAAEAQRATDDAVARLNGIPGDQKGVTPTVKAASDALISATKSGAESEDVSSQIAKALNLDPEVLSSKRTGTISTNLMPSALLGQNSMYKVGQGEAAVPLATALGMQPDQVLQGAYSGYGPIPTTKSVMINGKMTPIEQNTMLGAIHAPAGMSTMNGVRSSPQPLVNPLTATTSSGNMNDILTNTGIANRLGFGQGNNSATTTNSNPQDANAADPVAKLNAIIALKNMMQQGQQPVPINPNTNPALVQPQPNIPTYGLPANTQPQPVTPPPYQQNPQILQFLSSLAAGQSAPQ